MKTIELEDELYRYIASQTKDIGESASDILRRLLGLSVSDQSDLTEGTPLPASSTITSSESTDNNQQVTPAVAPAQSAPEPTVVAVPAAALVVTPEPVFNNTVLPASIDKLITSKEFKDTTVSVTKFIQILSVLYAEHPSAFESATDIKGRKRIYFAKSEGELLSGGNTTKPRKIENTPYWVITNTNTGRKRNIVTQLMAEMGYPHVLIDAVSQSI